MRLLVCVKRVPATGGQITLTADHRDIDARFLGFTVSPHEECAVEEAVRIVEAQGGTSAVLTLGPESAADQLRDAMAIGIDRAILLETDGSDWDPGATAGAIVDAIRDLEAAERTVRPDPVRQRVSRLAAGSRSGSGSRSRSTGRASRAPKGSRSTVGRRPCGARLPGAGRSSTWHSRP